MATESYTVEGLDAILDTIFPGGQTLYLGLWSALANTTGEGPTTLGDTPHLVTLADITEVDYASYARVSMAGSQWQTPAAAGTAGRKIAALQQSFPQATGNGTLAANGWFLASVASGAGKLYGLALFDDQTPFTPLLGDIPRLIPTCQMNF